MKLKLWQFRLRSLFALLLFFALAAAWWSHRHHCLERVEFHDGQAKSLAWDAVKAEFQAMLAAVINQVREQESIARKQQQVLEMVQEAFARQWKSNDHDFFDESVPERGRVARAISAGYLLAPIAPMDEEPVPPTVNSPPPAPRAEPTVLIQVEPPQPPAPATIVPEPSPEQIAWETRAKALHQRSEFHTQQKERFLRAIYRPWMNLQEPAMPEVPPEPK